MLFKSRVKSRMFLATFLKEFLKIAANVEHLRRAGNSIPSAWNGQPDKGTKILLEIKF